MINLNKVIHLGYIDWINDLYKLVDLVVLTNEGVMIQEAMVYNIPTIALTKVKYCRYHNMAGIFKGAVIDSNIEELNDKIEESLAKLDEIKMKTNEYSEKFFYLMKK